MRRILKVDDARCYGCDEKIRLHIHIWAPHTGQPRTFHRRCKRAYLEGLGHGGLAADRRRAPSPPD